MSSYIKKIRSKKNVFTMGSSNFFCFKGLRWERISNKLAYFSNDESLDILDLNSDIFKEDKSIGINKRFYKYKETE